MRDGPVGVRALEWRFDPAVGFLELRPRHTGRLLVGAAPLQDIA
jgi:hypothetical protein